MPSELFEKRLTLRLACSADDEKFLQTLYADARASELAVFGWDREREDAFFKMQFEMQARAYAMQFPRAVTLVVELDERRIGRMITEQGSDETKLIDISLLAEFRDRGIGTQILENLKADSKTVLLQVLKTNVDAKRFYDRQGFETIDVADLHWTMRWKS
ncbi:MAG: GNAT family N-acetyltransferase [Acidobacteria bacterium]|nr:GNAT family N-acetyltransferase [Acidobacteriota bacterium]